MKKLNCWEFKKCGREPEGERGERVEEPGACSVCPVTAEKRLDGVHGGRNAGRSCWVVVGTSCGERWWTLAEKLSNCIECDFYNKVRKEEGAKFILAAVLLQISGMAGDEASYFEGHPRSFRQF